MQRKYLHAFISLELTIDAAAQPTVWLTEFIATTFSYLLYVKLFKENVVFVETNSHRL